MLPLLLLAALTDGADGFRLPLPSTHVCLLRPAVSGDCDGLPVERMAAGFRHLAAAAWVDGEVIGLELAGDALYDSADYDRVQLGHLTALRHVLNPSDPTLVYLIRGRSRVHTVLFTTSDLEATRRLAESLLTGVEVDLPRRDPLRVGLGAAFGLVWAGALAVALVLRRRRA